MLSLLYRCAFWPGKADPTFLLLMSIKSVDMARVEKSYWVIPERFIPTPKAARVDYLKPESSNRVYPSALSVGTSCTTTMCWPVSSQRIFEHL